MESGVDGRFELGWVGSFKKNSTEGIGAMLIEKVSEAEKCYSTMGVSNIFEGVIENFNGFYGLLIVVGKTNDVFCHIVPRGTIELQHSTEV